MAALVALVSSVPAVASSAADVEQCFLDQINAERATTGAGPLALDQGVSEYARSHSAAMAKMGSLYHSSSDNLAGVLPDGWRAWGENVGMASGGGVCERLHNAFMNSPGHRANLMNPAFDNAAIGVVVDSSGTTWTTHVFFDGPTLLAGLPPFVDDNGSVHEGDIIRLAEAGITKGCASDRFCPDDAVTRGQMAAFLARAFDLPGTSVDYFTDDVGSMFESSINALAGAGITRGCGSGSFCPEASITRAEMAAFLARVLGLPSTSADFFVDDDGSPFEPAINSLAAAGITSGCRADSYCPNLPVSRAQMATFLVRAAL